MKFLCREGKVLDLVHTLCTAQDIERYRIVMIKNIFVTYSWNLLVICTSIFDNSNKVVTLRTVGIRGQV